MGGHPYWYVVPYGADVDAALQKLHRRELRTGRYNPVTPFPEFPVDPSVPGPGGRHRDFDDALADADADGTRSIVDLSRAALTPWDGVAEPFMIAWPVPDDDVAAMTGSAAPSLQDLLQCDDLWDRTEHGAGLYVVLEDSGRPSQIFFAGCSFD